MKDNEKLQPFHNWSSRAIVILVVVNLALIYSNWHTVNAFKQTHAAQCTLEHKEPK